MPADLWSFTLDFYARPGIEQACLRLQAQGADVCMLLCGVWLGQRQVACTPERVRMIEQLAVPWQQEVVRPLRTLRSQWREAARSDTALTSLREQVKALELQAEQRLLERLEALGAGWPGGQEQAVERWLDALAGQAASQDRDTLQVLCVAAGASG